MKTVKKIINGVEYTAVWKGIAYADEATEKCCVNGKNTLSPFLLSEIVFNEIIIEPKVCIDDFYSLEEFYEVLDFGKSVLYGEFETHKSKGKLKREVLDQWGAWRLVFCDMANFEYEKVFYEMTPQEIEKANIALDIVNEEIKRQSKKKH